MMTSQIPTVLDPEEVGARLDPTVRVRRGLALGLAVAGPALLFAGGLLAPDLGGSNAEVVAAVLQVADQLLTAHLVNTVASLAYIATVFVTWRITDPRGSVLRLLGGAIAILGFLSNALGEVLFGYTAWAGAAAHVPGAVEARMFDVLDASAAALPVSWLAIPVAVLGMVVLWIGVIRAHRTIPVWAPILAIVGSTISVVAPGGLIGLVGVVATVGTIATVLLAARTKRP